MEAAAAAELYENFKDNTNYRVPRINWEITSRRILIMEYIYGIRIDDLVSLQKNNHDIKKITEIGTEVFFLQVFRDGFFHGDMHPGNILIDKKGTLVPIDFGIMGRLSNNDRQFLALLLIHLLNKNYKKAYRFNDLYNTELLHNKTFFAIEVCLYDLSIKDIESISKKFFKVWKKYIL